MDGTRLDLVCGCGFEYEAIIYNEQDSIKVECPNCKQLNTLSKTEIERILDKVENDIWKKLGL